MGIYKTSIKHLIHNFKMKFIFVLFGFSAAENVMINEKEANEVLDAKIARQKRDSCWFPPCGDSTTASAVTTAIPEAKQEENTHEAYKQITFDHNLISVESCVNSKSDWKIMKMSTHRSLKLLKNAFHHVKGKIGEKITFLETKIHTKKGKSIKKKNMKRLELLILIKTSIQFLLVPNVTNMFRVVFQVNQVEHVFLSPI